MMNPEPMSQPPQTDLPIRAPRDAGWRVLRRMWRGCLWIALSLVLLVASLAATAVLLSGRPVALPVWAVAELQARSNTALAGQARMSLGGVSLRIAEGGQPELRIEDLRIAPQGQSSRAVLPEVTVRFDALPLLAGRLRPVSVRMTGARVALRRLQDGTFDIDVGGGGVSPPSTLAELLDRIADSFNLPMASALQRAEADAVTITLDDRRAGRIYRVGDGRIALTRRDGRVVLDLGMNLVGEAAQQARAQLSFVMPGDGGAELSVRVDDITAADLAAQAPALAPLRALMAPISGDMHAGLAADGSVSFLTGALSIGAGALQPLPGVRPLPVHSADLEFSLDPSKMRLKVARLAVDSPALQMQSAGHVDLIGLADGIPTDFVSQLAFSELRLNPQGVFEDSVRFSQGAADVRLRLDPFSVDVGQFSLVEEDRHLSVTGKVLATPEGWEVAVDLAQNKIRHDQLLALWPVQLAAKTREWLAVNVQQGLFFDVKAGLRIRPGQEPRLSLGYEFADADVRFMPTLPPIRKGRGYAVVEGSSYLTVVEDGIVTPPDGGEIRVTRSLFRVPDFREKPARAEIRLSTESSLTAALSLLDQPPFGFLTKAKMPTDLGEGRAALEAEFTLPLIRKVPRDQIGFQITGRLTDVRSERLVRGRVLTAGALTLTADPRGVSVGGDLRLGQARANATWTLPLGVPPGSGSRVTGQAVLDEGLAAEFLQAFGPGVLSGRGMADFTVTLLPGQPPALTASSDLRGAALRISQLNWSKAAASRGRLELAGSLAQPMRFERVHLAGPGLSATGSLTLAEGGGLGQLALSEVQIGDWLDASARLTGTGKGRPPRVELTGGSFDLRALPPGMQGGSGAGGGGGQRVPLQVALDRVKLTGGVELTQIRGEISSGAGGIDGRLTARLNGQVPVQLDLTRSPRGTSVRLRAEDGGAALRAAGLFAKAHGGALDVALVPTGRAGHYQGQIAMAGFVVRDLPALAEILSAVSIIGLVDQITTSGVAFSEASGGFRITPDGVELNEVSAVGASFGVSLEGVYYTREDRLNLRGVISPFYLINAIGSVLTRPGEGLVGFTYRVEGQARAPQVSVNPFSALAPGFLRDMLRRPAAKLAP